MGKGRQVTQGLIDSIIPEPHWVLATNETSTSWEDTSSGARAIVYWDWKNKDLRGLVYGYYRDRSPWSQGDRYTLFFDDVLKTKKDVTAYRKSMPPSSQGRFAKAWDRRWSVSVYDSQKFIETPEAGDSYRGMKYDSMKLSDFFMQAKTHPYKFIPPAFLDWGIVNMRYLDKEIQGSVA